MAGRRIGAADGTEAAVLGGRAQPWLPRLPRLPWPSTMPMQTWMIVCGCPVGWSSAFSLPKSVLSGENLGAPNRRRLYMYMYI